MLTVTQTGHTTLELDGGLAEDQEHADWSKPRSFGNSRIVGLLDTPGDYVLLEGLERTDFSVTDEGPKKQSFTASSCTRRQFEFPNNYEQSGFTELRVDLKGLEEWLELDSILIERDYGHLDGERTHVTYTDHKISFPLLGGTIAIESLTTGGNFFLYHTERPVRDVKFEQSFYINYQPEEPSDLSHLQYIYSKLEEFMALMLGSYFRFDRPTLIRKEEPFDGWVTVYVPGTAPTSEPPSRYEYWLQFSDIRDLFGKLFAEWLAGSELYGAGFYLYVAALRNPHVYTEDRLFTLATGIEALHRKCFDSENSDHALREKQRVAEILSLLPESSQNRKWLAKKLAYAHELSLEGRLLESLRELPIPFGKSQLEKFVKRCAARRNDISHRGGPSGDMDYSAFHQETLRLAEALDCLFHILLCHKIGMPRDILLKLMTKSIIAERLIKPALASAGLEITSAPDRAET
jgi:ApeA N-terminal domain 1